MADIEKNIIDSLKRQIVEAKKQISQVVSKSKSKNLELQRKNDKTKAKFLIKILKLKKQAIEIEENLQEHRKSWNLEFHNTRTLIMV
jgi:hypothetical protein